MKKRLTALTLACLMLVCVLAGCGGGTGAGDDTTFSWWIYSGANSNFYTDYQENPAVQYTLSKTYGPEDKKVALEFWTPAPGKENDNYSTMLVSGDLPDLIDMVICDPAPIMVEKGYAMDITEYVERNMPNYVALVHSNDTYLKNAVFMVDGVEHYYCLENFLDKPEDVFQGFQYRRDWIVKYGTNPQTGAAFTGGFTDENDPDAWTDDVVFPSGGPDPIYISDWEWMFEIFEKAMADQGIDDSYCMSLYYPGFTWSGGLLSCFGGGVNVWYQDENGKVHFGGDEKYFRAYLECMHTWYEKGWLDQDFYQRTSDAFYQIDETAVRQGKVGMFNGEQSKLGGRMDMNDGGFTEGIFVKAAPYPINDIYGDADCQGKAPNCVMGGEIVGGGVLITPKAAEKDLDTLCAYFDQFYAEEGALIKTLGLNADQVAEFTDNTFYNDYNMPNGCYFVNDEGGYEKDPVLAQDSGGLGVACGFNKAPGLQLVENVDLGLADTFQSSLDQWVKYPNTGFFQGTITTNMMSTEDSQACDEVRSRVLEYMTNNAVNFITGEKDITSDDDWGVWCKSLQKYNYQKVSDIYQPYVDQYPFA